MQTSAVPVVYLAGPIHNATVDQRDGWRKTAAAELASHGIDVISPLGHDGSEHEAIVQTDLELIRRATCVLAWVPAGVPSPGTAMEIFWASRILGLLVLGWGDSTSPWIRAHWVAIEPTLDAAVADIVAHPEQFCGAAARWERTARLMQEMR